MPPENRIATVPNGLTLLRLVVFTPLACTFLAIGRPDIALLAMVLGEATDFSDGIVARRISQISDLGKLLDPLSDSVFHMAIWMTLLSLGWAPLYLVILFFARDAIVQTVRSYLASRQVVLAARMTGKLKAGFQAGAQLAVVSLHVFYNSNTLEMAVIWLAALMTFASLADYLWCAVKPVFRMRALRRRRNSRLFLAAAKRTARALNARA